LFGDVFHFLASQDKLKLIPEFLRFYDRDLSYDIWSSKDLLPAIVRLLNGFRYVWSREMWKYAFTRA